MKNTAPFFGCPAYGVEAWNGALVQADLAEKANALASCSNLMSLIFAKKVGHHHSPIESNYIVISLKKMLK